MQHEPEFENAEGVQKDLYELAGLLENGLLYDAKPIYECFVQKCADGSWAYSLNNLEFRLSTLPGGTVKPNDIAEGLSVSILFSIKINGCLANADEIVDPVIGGQKDYQFDVILDGEYLTADVDVKVGRLFAAWHFDKEPDTVNPYFFHPIYHATFGGNRMEQLQEQGYNFGNALILPAPRLPHPPMDAVLGIDFILRNYFSRELHESVTSSLDYKRILFRSQYRLWRPWAMAFASKWNGFQCALAANHILPNLMPS